MDVHVLIFGSTCRLEQELMARIITEIYPLPEREEPADVSHIVSEGSEDSIAEDKEQSIFGKSLHLSRKGDISYTREGGASRCQSYCIRGVRGQYSR